MILQNFIVLEGIDGAGTSTQLDILKNTAGTEKFLFTAEPSPSPVGKFLRTMLKGDVPVSNETAAYIFAADRNEHVNGKMLVDGDRHLVTGISEACSKGHTVVSDRYFFSSLAYQSIQCRPEVPRILNSLFPLPRLLVYFDISPEKSLERIGGRCEREIYENLDFLKKTVRQYEKVVEEYSDPEKSQGMEILRVDATKSKEDVAKSIHEKIRSLGIEVA
ncbi:MAG: dTMP kinase [Treponema sp.]|nr:dTMP kinase [Treponema sp.]